MKSIQVLIALVIVVIGISGAIATAPLGSTYPIATGELRASGVGQLDFGMTVVTDALAPSASQATYPTVTATNNGALLAFVQGATINNVDEIHSSIVGQSTGGDVAESHLDVLGDRVNAITPWENTASAKNYNMYGYVTSNLAYTGQYADSITGESIDMVSESWNKQSSTAFTSPHVGSVSTYPTYNGYTPSGDTGLATSYLGATSAVAVGDKTTKYTDGGSTYSTAGYTFTQGPNSGYSFAEKKAVNSGLTDTAQVSMTTAYQFAQAGGSQSASAYPQGIWTQAVNDKAAKISGVNSGTILNQVSTEYLGLNSLSQSANSALTQTGTATLTSNAQEMGYADASMVYANKDSLLAGNANTPYYSTTSSTNLNGVAHSSADTGGNLPVASGQNELFAYSIVDANNPSGLSTHLFF